MPTSRAPRPTFEIGTDLLAHRQKYLDATPHLETALQQFPDDTDILKYLGFAHRMIARQYSGTSHAGELRLSNTYYRRALDVDPNRRDFLEYMGELYLEMNDVAAAKEKLAALERRVSRTDAPSTTRSPLRLPLTSRPRPCKSRTRLRRLQTIEPKRLYVL